MLLVTYDFTDDKTRTKFSKFLKKFGVRIQYSVFRIKNSPRVLNNIVSEIEHKYRKMFGIGDSIFIFKFCEGCDKKVLKFGHAANEEVEILFM
jgi:CRISPR-associated protein Cas2